LHLVMDNYGTHKKEEVRAWLKKHPRFVLHFVPTSSSWLNLVERWFSELSSQCIRRGAFFSVEDLKKAIREFLATWNEDPKPFCVDRYRGIDQGKAVSLPANLGEDSARLYPATGQKEGTVTCPAILRTLH